MALGEDIEGAEIGFILLALLALGAGAYFLVKKFGQTFGAGTPDAGGGAPATSALGGIVDQLEIGHSSESYEDAASQVEASPFQSAKTIIGGWWNDLVPSEGNNY